MTTDIVVASFSETSIIYRTSFRRYVHILDIFDLCRARLLIVAHLMQRSLFIGSYYKQASSQESAERTEYLTSAHT